MNYLKFAVDWWVYYTQHLVERTVDLPLDLSTLLHIHHAASHGLHYYTLVLNMILPSLGNCYPVICIYVCMHLRTSFCRYTYIYIHIYIYIYTMVMYIIYSVSIYICIGILSWIIIIYIYIYVCACVCVCVSLSLYIYIYIIHTKITHVADELDKFIPCIIYIYIYICVCVCVCVCGQSRRDNSFIHANDYWRYILRIKHIRYVHS